jgi:drug/metabolite transporter (DMT)-like permease
MAGGRWSGHADGLLSGATWGVVAVLLPTAGQLPSASLPATSVAVAAIFDAAAAVFLLTRAGIADVVKVLTSRRALAIGLCSLLGGPLFMGGYVAAVLLAGPADALTATATYPVLGAILARPLLRQRLDRVGWLGVVAAAAGATLIAVDAGSGTRNLIGIGLALVAAAAVALEGIVATRAMVGLDTNTVMAGRELLSAVMFGLVVLVVPGAVTAVGQIVADAGLTVLIAGAGAVGGYSYVIWYRSIRKIGVAKAMALNISYAMWGVLFAWIVLHAPPEPLAITGCVVVSAGAVLTILSGRREAERAGPVGPAHSIRGVLLRGLLPTRLLAAAGGNLHRRRHGGEVLGVPGGLHDEDVAHRVGHHLAGDRPEHLPLLGAQAAVADDDEVLRVVPGRLQEGPRGRRGDDPPLERAHPLPDGQLPD